MKQLLRKLFAPILNIFEKGDKPFAYKTSHRKILITVGCLFSGLAGLIIYLAQGQDPAYYFPAVIFASAGIVSLVVGSLGTDRAVAQIWGSR
jgi:hypothetical protein